MKSSSQYLSVAMLGSSVLLGGCWPAASIPIQLNAGVHYRCRAQQEPIDRGEILISLVCEVPNTETSNEFRICGVAVAEELALFNDRASRCTAASVDRNRMQVSASMVAPQTVRAFELQEAPRAHADAERNPPIYRVVLRGSLP